MVKSHQDFFTFRFRQFTALNSNGVRKLFAVLLLLRLLQALVSWVDGLFAESDEVILKKEIKFITVVKAFCISLKIYAFFINL